jgi:hypothetical protein
VSPDNPPIPPLGDLCDLGGKYRNYRSLLLLGEGQRVGDDVDLRGEFVQEATAAGVGQLDEEGGPAFGRRGDFADVSAGPLLAEVGAFPDFADGLKSEIPGLGVSRLPELHR